MRPVQFAVVLVALALPSIASADEDEPERPVPRARFGIGAGPALTACGDFCDAITNPAYGFRAFSIWPVDEGFGLGFTADLGLFPEHSGPAARGFFMGGLLEVSSGYRATSSFSFWLAVGAFSGEQGGTPCSPDGLGLQAGLRAGTRLFQSVFVSLAVSGAGNPYAGSCAARTIPTSQARRHRAPVEALGLATLEVSYELRRRPKR